ncbi:Hpt domain-containing protein [Cellulomonas sp. ES6]|uniref:Hpt domain-containing protein n=1 Tax=Cellulomonas sp. ES6 TaxID=3039384 RepID=UPI0024B859A8|nr:Hpt domain-containing protein [Cellulomonas sp. ES6]WHP19008.1 Hpt domain-containing protein [Cellulomonas sp. ES6]
MDDIVREFLVESHENLDQLDQDLVALESEPGSRALIASVFRTIHTIKGTSGFLAFSHLERVAHAGENLLVELRDGRRSMDQATTDVLLRLVDTIREILRAIEAEGGEGAVEIDAVIAAIEAIQATDPSAAPAPVAETPAAPAAAVEPAEPRARRARARARRGGRRPAARARCARDAVRAGRARGACHRRVAVGPVHPVRRGADPGAGARPRGPGTGPRGPGTGRRHPGTGRRDPGAARRGSRRGSAPSGAAPPTRRSAWTSTCSTPSCGRWASWCWPATRSAAWPPARTTWTSRGPRSASTSSPVSCRRGS